MTRAGDAVAAAQEQIAFWLGQDDGDGDGDGIGAIEAWAALTGEYREHVSWAEVRGYMIGWWLRQYAAQERRRAA